MSRSGYVVSIPGFGPWQGQPQSTFPALFGSPGPVRAGERGYQRNRLLRRTCATPVSPSSRVLAAAGFPVAATSSVPDRFPL